MHELPYSLTLFQSANRIATLRKDPFAAFYLEPPPADVSDDVFSEDTFNSYFGLISNEDLVIIRPSMDDDDDRVLEELRPKYIIVYDPDQGFVRRVEVSPFSCYFSMKC